MQSFKKLSMELFYVESVQIFLGLVTKIQQYNKEHKINWSMDFCWKTKLKKKMVNLKIIPRQTSRFISNYFKFGKLFAYSNHG